MRENLQRLTLVMFFIPDLLQQGCAMLPDLGTDHTIFTLHRLRLLQGYFDSFLDDGVTQRCIDSIQPPSQVHRSRSRRCQLVHGDGQLLRIFKQRQIDAIGSGYTNQGRAAHLHRLDGMTGILECIQGNDFKAMRQASLINNINAIITLFEPDALVLLPVNFHYRLDRM